MSRTAVDTHSPSALVTGAAGFIGSHVAEHCLRLGMSVVAVDDLSGGFLENVPAGVEWRLGDVRDPAFVASLWRNRQYDYVYHIAAYAAEGLSHFIRRYNYQTNLIGSVNLLNESVKHDVKCFVFTSSIAVYGKGQTPMVESMIPQPEDPYGISKYAVELDLRAAHEMFGTNYIVFRPHNVYGVRQNIADPYRNVIGIFMNQSLQGLPMTIFGDGLQTRAFSHVDDVAPIIARGPLVCEAYNETFNVGADTPFSVKELAEEVARVLERPYRAIHLPARNEVVHAFSNHDKVRNMFASSPSRDLATGLNEMAQWVRRRGVPPMVAFKEFEIEKNMPPSWRP